MGKNKLLLIFFRAPYPLLSGGQIRMYQNLRILSKHFDIDLLFLTDGPVENSTIKELSKYTKDLHWYTFKKSQYYLNTLRGLFTSDPLQTNYFYSRKVQKWIDRNIKKYPYVFCHTIRTTKYVQKHSNTIKIVDFVDAISMNYEKAYQKKNFGLWKLLYYIDKNRLKRYEEKILNEFDKSIIISNVDKEYILSENSKKSIKVVPNCIFPDIVKNNYTIPEKHKICFIGKMDYEPNQTAVFYFINKILPHVVKKNPTIKFEVVGVQPTEQIKNLSVHNNINVTGYVEDIEREIKESKIIVAPMVSGAGIQNKILQSMYLKKCVVTTTLGAEGLINVTNNEIIVEDNPSAFAEKINYYLANKDLRDSIGINAKEYIKKTFSEEKVEQLLKEYLID
ncbi:MULTISPECIES: glycosyltransferase family 4 protein [Tenacibaculum]|uniref:glycosyltransferase family 4 protein n=1 Tax=Tenacibaculum TaxID=104267 RepID=UPI001F0AF998|nr:MULTISPECIES: glycosyltransferase family 4 protein [Tenacibaculum]MCH3881384.1 glycosyltransferase family 4 protein [Tenacibaculum aquimarinum]MDO6599022.1 glycosyltransferase family 4 protein [Tenacibaculum sp. 1_MG-2023]